MDSDDSLPEACLRDLEATAEEYHEAGVSWETLEYVFTRLRFRALEEAGEYELADGHVLEADR